MTKTQTEKLHTAIRSIGTCKNCGALHLFVGTTYARNGQVCLCEQGSRLTHFTAPEAKGQDKGRIAFRKISGTRTDHPCDEACTSAKSDACACVCGGDNHGARHWGGW
jgi:hypothetical protein